MSVSGSESSYIQVWRGEGDEDDSGWDEETIQVTPKVRWG